MLVQTNYNISSETLQELRHQLPKIDYRLALNESNGSFFSDPWAIKPEFKDTIWDQVLRTIPDPIGEARLIQLEQGEAYPSHADIDDRWHLNIVGDHSYLIDLEKEIMHPIKSDGVWYSMNAGIRHSAVNFGTQPRVQLVVRQLLPKNEIAEPVKVSVKFKYELAHNRFIFDDMLSPWLNRAYKSGIVADFAPTELEAQFTVEAKYLNELLELTRGHFILKIL